MFHMKHGATCILAACLSLFTRMANAEDAFVGATSNIGNSVAGAEASAGGLASVDLSTGSLRFNYDFDLPTARGAVQPNLSIHYNSSSGVGLAGYGWSLSVPSILRVHPSGSRGAPIHIDPPSPDADRFVFGGVPLVPICYVGECQLQESFPDQLNGWLYFRREVESDFSRFFWSPDKRTWVIQDKSGNTTELGSPRDRPEDVSGIESDESGFFRWNIVRRYDRHGPLNRIKYEWNLSDQIGIRYLTDIYDTVDQQGNYAHRTHLSYAPRQNLRVNLSPHWHALPFFNLTDVLVTSATEFDPSRYFVRRYKLTYSPAWYSIESNNSGIQHLSRIDLEGRCSSQINETQALLGTNCPLFQPATRMNYGLPNYGPVVRTLAGRGPLDPFKDQPVLADVNADGLADIVQPSQQPNQRQTVWINTKTAGLVQQSMPFFPNLLNANSATFLSKDKADQALFGDFLSNGRVSAIWRDGGNSAVYSSVDLSGNPAWIGSPSSFGLPPEFSAPPHPNGKFVPTLGDVNADGIVDLIGNYYTNYLSIKTAAGNVLPFAVPVAHPLDISGNGLVFGAPNNVCIRDSQLQWTGAGTSDAAMQIVDMNADGLDDKVRIRLEVQSRCAEYIPEASGCGSASLCVKWEQRISAADIWTFPGRGDGVFDEQQGLFYMTHVNLLDNVNHIPMTSSFVLGDVNGDGLADLGILGSSGLKMFMGYFRNDLETGMSQRPFSSIYGNYDVNKCLLRLGDANGAGLSDYIIVCPSEVSFVSYDEEDITKHPNLLLYELNKNGLSSTIDYSSTRYIQGKSIPQVVDVVSKISTTNGLPQGKAEKHTVEYSYENPGYDPVAREFRGFQDVTATSNGISSKTHFLLGECPGCPFTVDRPTYALRSLATLQETTNGQSYLSTKHTSYALTSLYSGADGRRVRHVYPTRMDSYVYETSPYISSPATNYYQDVISSDPTNASLYSAVTVRSNNNLHTLSTVYLDTYGNQTLAADYGRFGIDQPIVTSVSWLTYGSTWQWLKNEIQTGARRVSFEYDHLGQVSEIYGYLTGTVDLDRRHEDPIKPVAPNPIDQSGGKNGQTAQVLLASYERDLWGNITFVSTTNGRCSEAAYDSLFHQMPITATKYVGNPTSTRGYTCGDRNLTTYSEFDRGLEKTTRVISPTQVITVSQYDGFGRITDTVSSNGSPSHVDYLPRSDYGPVQVVHATGEREAYTYIDGYGNTVLTIESADINNGDYAPWIASGLPDYNNSGKAYRNFAPGFYSGDPAAYPLNQSTSSTSNRVEFDDYDRISAEFERDGTQVSQTVYHPSIVESYSERQLSLKLPPTVTITDGHGRPVETSRSLGGDRDDKLVVNFSYLDTGELTRVDQWHTKGTDHVVRTMQYDSFGRMVRNVEPNTSIRDIDAITGAPVIRAWTYAYNDSGDIVGTSDARGCGRNFTYDAGGRALTEDYSPCKNSQALYTTEPEVRNVYDVSEEPVSNPEFYIGNLTASYDRASHLRFRYDARGRIVQTAKQVVSPTPGQYASHWFIAETNYDSSDRAIYETTGADVPELLVNGSSAVSLRYSRRGTLAEMSSSYGTLLRNIVTNAEGFETFRQYGDAAATMATATMDSRGRLDTSSVFRYLLNPNPVSNQEVLASDRFIYDRGVLSEIRDQRHPNEWPDGAKPVDRTFFHDGLGRLKYTRYGYATFNGLDKNNLDEQPSRRTDFRILTQRFDYDWLGNLVKNEDDSQTLWDRSFGNATVSVNRITHAGALGMGGIDAVYDESGNVATIVVRRDSSQCASSGACTHRFVYEWDEIGQLSRARRFDDNQTSPQVDKTFVYTGDGQRVLSSSNASYTVDVFPSLRLENARFLSGDYERSVDTERVTLPGAQLVYNSDLPGTNPLHVFLNIGDNLGSSSIVLDKETGELVERSTYESYGKTDSDYRPARWNKFRSTYRFNGKEDDLGIGLTYFGARYYIPSLTQWASADPLTIHAMGSDINPYAYVMRSPVSLTDKTGLTPCIGVSIVDNPCPPGTFPAPDGGGPGPNDVWQGPPPLESKAVEEDKKPQTASRPQKISQSFVDDVMQGLKDNFQLVKHEFDDVQATVKALKVTFSKEEYGHQLWNLGVQNWAEGMMGTLLPFGGGMVPGLTTSAAEYLTAGLKYDAAPLYQNGVVNGASLAAHGTQLAIETIASAGVGGIAAAGRSGVAAAARSGVPRAYSVVTEVTIEALGIGTRQSHFWQANKIVLGMMKENQSFAKMIRTLVPEFESSVLTKSGRVIQESPAGMTWHHVLDRPGVLQLVYRDDHNWKTGKLFQYLFHPGNKGGFKKWGDSY